MGKMPKQRITTAINKVLNEQFGFEIYKPRSK